MASGQRIAIIADIHANVWALNAVLSDIRRERVDVLVNLGDVLYGPLAPLATFERLQSEKVVLTVRGNQDRQIYDGSFNSSTLNFVIQDLGEEAISWLKGLPETAVFEDEIFLCHGTPSSDETYLLEDVSSGRAVLKPEEEIVRLVGGVRYPVILCGHSHLPRLVSLAGGQIILNPGSVGLPAYSDELPVPHVMETYSPHASYAILTRTATGWDVAFQKVAYDFERASQVATERGREDWAKSIATGRVNE
jgi:putative phosphoesterase